MGYWNLKRNKEREGKLWECRVIVFFWVDIRVCGKVGVVSLFILVNPW
jgi:hypothetical protein